MSKLLLTIALVVSPILPASAGEPLPEAWGDIPLFLNRQADATLVVAESALCSFPPRTPEPFERRMTLLMLDGLLHDADAPAREPIQRFFHRSVQRAVFEMEQKHVKEGALIWKLYNHAFVVRTPTVTLGFDLTRASSARVPDFALPDTLMARLVRQCDVLFISHHHGDHADPWVAQRFLDENKPVVAPEDIFVGSPMHDRIHHLSRDPDQVHSLPVQQGGQVLEVVVFPGYQGERILNNVTWVVTPEKLSFCHTGDQSNTDSFAWIDKVGANHSLDVLLPNCWTTGMIRMIRGMQPRVVITGHENELGHSIDHREAYWRTYQRLEGSPAPWVLMTWGESYHYDPARLPTVRPRTHQVTVQPIITRDDAGEHSARNQLEETLIDQVYSAAGVDFQFRDPLWYDSTAARDGQINLDTIQANAVQAGLIDLEQPVVYLFFVNQVDGHAGPLGRGRQDGNVVFVALGESMPRAQVGFVLAHEIGHNLGLRHAVDDADVPDDVPNLMGDGAYENRLTSHALVEPQVKTIHASRLAVPMHGGVD